MKTYGTTCALDDLTLAVAAGEFFGFLGPNGAGKTTTIRIMTGIVRPDRGDVLIGGMAPDRHREIARLIGVVPESRGFYDWMTATEYLDFFAGLYLMTGDRRQATGDRRVSPLLEQVGLLASRDVRIGAFSRGMRQRLGLARALINRPQILFLDEPTLGLDPQGQRDIQDLLQRLNAEGVTVFLSSHLLHEVADLCTRIAVISQGRLVADGTLAELRSRTGLEAGYRFRIAGTLSALGTMGPADRITHSEPGPTSSEFVFRGSPEEANALIDGLRARHIPLLEFQTEEEDLTGIFLALTAGSREPRAAGREMKAGSREP